MSANDTISDLNLIICDLVELEQDVGGPALAHIISAVDFAIKAVDQIKQDIDNANNRGEVVSLSKYREKLRCGNSSSTSRHTTIPT